MTEGESKGPRIIRQSKKPKEKPGMKYIPVRDDPWKTSRITGWMAVSTEPSLDLPPEMEKLSKEPPRKMGSVTEEQLEKSAKKGWQTFIDRSQPTGDKD